MILVILLIATFVGSGLCQIVDGPILTMDGQQNSISALSFGQPGSQTASQTPPSKGPFCTAAEKKAVFDNCLFGFGFSHLSSFTYLKSNAPYCRAEVFKCFEVDKMNQCLNSQPKTVISDSCWTMLDVVMNDSFKGYGIPCRSSQIEKQCPNVTPLVPITKRKASGRGISNNPMQQIMTSIQLMIMMMRQTGNYGMFAPIAQAFGA